MAQLIRCVWLLKNLAIKVLLIWLCTHRRSKLIYWRFWCSDRTCWHWTCAYYWFPSSMSSFLKYSKSWVFAFMCSRLFIRKVIFWLHVKWSDYWSDCLESWFLIHSTTANSCRQAWISLEKRGLVALNLQIFDWPSSEFQNADIAFINLKMWGRPSNP